MAITIAGTKEVQTGLRVKSLFVLMEADVTGERRMFEFGQIELSVTLADLNALYTVQQIWEVAAPVGDKVFEAALFDDKVAAALAAIESELALLPTATTADLKGVLANVLKRQRQIISVIARMKGD